MKKIVLFFAAIGYFVTIHAQTANSISNGNWLNPTTWDCMCIPTPGYTVMISHNVSLDTDFACSTGSITIQNSGSLIQNTSNRNLWIYGSAYLTNGGTLTVDNILYEGNDGSLINNGTINAGSIHITSGLQNGIGTINADSLFNSGLLENAGTINLIAITNDSLFLNNSSGNLIFSNFSNFGIFQNNGWLTGSNSMWNQGQVINQINGKITIENDFLNRNLTTMDATFDNSGWLIVQDSWYNFDTIKGNVSGYIQVADSSVNNGTMKGNFDFCDLTPPASAPYVDFGTGIVEAGITWCTQQSLNEVGEIAIDLFPNPTSDFLHITISTISKETILLIFNTMGQLMTSTVVNENNLSIDVSALPKGYYLLMVKSEHAYVKKPFVVF